MKLCLKQSKKFLNISWISWFVCWFICLTILAIAVSILITHFNRSYQIRKASLTLVRDYDGVSSFLAEPSLTWYAESKISNADIEKLSSKVASWVKKVEIDPATVFEPNIDFSKFVNLEEFSASFSSLTPEIYQLLLSGNNLERLHLFSGLTEKQLTKLASNHPNLKSLEIRLVEVPDSSVWLKYPKLEYVKIKSELPPHHLFVLLQSCPNLESLFINLSQAIELPNETNQGVYRLRDLQLSDSGSPYKFSDAEVLALTKCLPRLVRLGGNFNQVSSRVSKSHHLIFFEQEY